MIRRMAPEDADEIAETWAIEFGDGSGNEERVPDVRYEWRPD